MAATLQSIFKTSFDAYASEHRLPLKHHQAARAIMTCRTPEQGGHVQQCPDGHEAHIQYHSCRHRSCPQCNALPKAQWAEKQYQRLLTTDHYHLIFTLPHELLPLWRYNQAWFTDTLFRAVSDTLLALSQDTKHLGALPGMILSLHTWGRNLILHPHIHCLMTGGGLSANGQWCSVKNGYLLPARVVRALYQGKLLSMLWQGLRANALQLPPDTSSQSQRQVLKAVARKKWNVCIQPPYTHGRGVMGYLARYVKGGPLSNQRITSANQHHVSFRYQDHRDGKQKTEQLSASHFIERLLDHVAEPKKHVIRHYGLYGHKARDKRNLCRAQLGQPIEERATEMSWEEFLNQSASQHKGECRQCGKRLVRGVVINKNSIFKVQGSGYVQQAVRADIETCSSDGKKPPDKPIYFFSGAMPLN
jgi:hypothetical protein